MCEKGEETRRNGEKEEISKHTIINGGIIKFWHFVWKKCLKKV